MPWFAAKPLREQTSPTWSGGTAIATPVDTRTGRVDDVRVTEALAYRSTPASFGCARDGSGSPGSSFVYLSAGNMVGSVMLELRRSSISALPAESAPAVAAV